MITMISGLHDPKWLPNILANYNRQKYRYKRLIIVENGQGVGACKNINLPKNVIILNSDVGVSSYINEGIKYLKENSWYDWWAKCDADDFYGPNYLNQINEVAKTNVDYAGRSSIFIRSQNNHLWYLDGKSTTKFHGPTLAGKVKSTPLFPLVKNWGEDSMWCDLMADKKAAVINPIGFCYQRYLDYNHAWPCTDDELIASWQAPVIDCGPFDLDVVNGLKKVEGTLIEPPELTIHNFMPFRLMKERGINQIGNI